MSIFNQTIDLAGYGPVSIGVCQSLRDGNYAVARGLMQEHITQFGESHPTTLFTAKLVTATVGAGVAAQILGSSLLTQSVDLASSSRDLSYATFGSSVEKLSSSSGELGLNKLTGSVAAAALGTGLALFSQDSETEEHSVQNFYSYNSWRNAQERLMIADMDYRFMQQEGAPPEDGVVHYDPMYPDAYLGGVDAYIAVHEKEWPGNIVGIDTDADAVAFADEMFTEACAQRHVPGFRNENIVVGESAYWVNGDGKGYKYNTRKEGYDPKGEEVDSDKSALDHPDIEVLEGEYFVPENPDAEVRTVLDALNEVEATQVDLGSAPKTRTNLLVLKDFETALGIVSGYDKDLTEKDEKLSLRFPVSDTSGDTRDLYMDYVEGSQTDAVEGQWQWRESADQVRYDTHMDEAEDELEEIIADSGARGVTFTADGVNDALLSRVSGGSYSLRKDPKSSTTQVGLADIYA